MSKRIDARAADRGCAKEALELLEEIDLRRYSEPTKGHLLAARREVAVLVQDLVAEGKS